MTTLRELQTNLPWTIRYSQDFRSNPQPHKDFAHAMHHVAKASGKLHALVDDMDHDRTVADSAALRADYGKYVADLVVCALRLANTFPGGVLDLERAVVDRIESKNAVKIIPIAEFERTGRVPRSEIEDASGCTHRDSTEHDLSRRCVYCGEPVTLNQAVFEFDRRARGNGYFEIVDGKTLIAHVGCGPR